MRFAEKCWLVPYKDVSIGFYSVARPGVCHSGASCSWRADDMVRSWKSTDQSENGLAGSDNWISGVWLNPYPVVHCSAEPLFAAKIFLSSLHGHMPQ